MSLFDEVQVERTLSAYEELDARVKRRARSKEPGSAVALAPSSYPQPILDGVAEVLQGSPDYNQQERLVRYKTLLAHLDLLLMQMRMDGVHHLTAIHIRRVQELGAVLGELIESPDTNPLQRLAFESTFKTWVQQSEGIIQRYGGTY